MLYTRFGSADILSHVKHHVWTISRSFPGTFQESAACKMQDIAIAPQASRRVDQPRRCEVVRGLKLRKTASELISGFSEYFPETRDRFVDKVPKFVDS